MKLHVAHTADLDASVLQEIRALLDEVFAESMTSADWDHALGGMHILIWDEDVLVGHAAVVQRSFVYLDRARRVGYIEGVGVREAYRRQGYGRMLMQEVDRLIEGAYEFGALASTDKGVVFYQTLGWQQWRGSTWVNCPQRLCRTPEANGSVWVRPASLQLDLELPLMCDWREGDVW